MTKKQQFEYYWKQFKEQKTLYHVYKNPSDTKIEIWNRIKRTPGHKHAVLSGNTFMFTAAYISKDKEDFVVVTKSGNKEYNIKEYGHAIDEII